MYFKTYKFNDYKASANLKNVYFQIDDTIKATKRDMHIAATANVYENWLLTFRNYTLHSKLTSAFQMWFKQK